MCLKAYSYNGDVWGYFRGQDNFHEIKEKKKAKKKVCLRAVCVCVCPGINYV